MATILIVDDRPADREYLMSLLGRGGHRLFQAADGAEALATARAEHPDLIIADIIMPTMDGYELVRQVRADPAIAQTPVIFCTANYHEREARALARTCGVSSVITKPSEMETILGAVEAALGLAPPAASPTAAEAFDREHLRLLTDKLSQKADDLSATNERLSALIDLSLQLGSELDLRRLMHSFGHAAREIVGARYSITGIMDADGSRFQSLYTSGIDAETAARLGSPDPRVGVLRTVLREGRCVRMHNPGGDPAALGFSPSHPPIHSWLGAPIASPTRVYGYVGLIDKIGLDEFSTEDERLAGVLAAQVGRVYQNGSLYSEVLSHAADLEREIEARAQTEKALAERVRQSLLIGEVGDALTRSETLRDMLQLCAQALVRHLDAALARIWTFNEAENVLELRASAGLYTHIDGPHSRVPFGETKIGEMKIGWIARERVPHLTNDVMTDPEVSDKEWARREGMVAFAGYPLIVEECLLGVVGIFARRPLDTATLGAIGAVAQQIALSIERNREIAERIAAEEALREREEHIRLLLDSTAEAIYGIDLRGCCTFANAVSARLLGYADTGQLLGKNMHALTHHTRQDGTPYPAKECRILRASLENQRFHVDDEVFWRADRSSFPAEYWSHPVIRDGETVGSVVTFLDITERRHLESQLQQAQKLESVGRLAGGVAHDFNNLLTVINGYSDLLLKELKPDDPVHESVTEIRKAGERAAALVRQLLLLSRKQVAQVTQVNLNEIITEVGKMLDRVIGDNIRLEFSLSPSLGCVLADPGQVHQILMNLAVNAHDAMPGGGTLLIETGNVNLDDSYVEQHAEVKPGPYVQLKFSDTGIGMTKDVMSHLFEPFFTTKKLGEGTGLGLATVYGIVQQSGGSIWAHSEPGDGTTFTIYLPRIDAGVALQREPAPEPASVRGTETILVVEDQDQVRRIAGRILRGYGYRVLEAAGAGQALLLSERYAGPIHLLLTDIVMPGMSGPELADRIKPLRPAIEIVFMSGYSERAIAIRQELTDSYLPKPFSPQDLAAKVRSVLRSPRAPDTILVVDDEPGIRNLLRKILTGVGYHVLEAANGREAIQQVETSKVDLVIMDLAMPEEEGIETIQALRRVLPQLKIIAISGQFAGPLLRAAKLLGAQASLAKPIQPDELLAAVAHVMVARET